MSTAAVPGGQRRSGWTSSDVQGRTLAAGPAWLSNLCGPSSGPWPTAPADERHRGAGSTRPPGRPPRQSRRLNAPPETRAHISVSVDVFA